MYFYRDNNENIIKPLKQHSGPITSISLHPGDFYNQTELSKVLITSSADWTINLWEENSEKPILTFDANDDYVYDCKFHTTNPSLFASVDGAGKLDFWDLNKDVECPVYRHDIGKDALNKLTWSHDGKRIAVGDINGKITLLNLDKDIVNTKPEEASKFQRVIDKYKQISNRREEVNN